MDKIGKLLESSRDQQVFSGAAYEIGTPDRTIAGGCVGTLEWGGEPVSESNLWDIASLTKVIVSLATMRLFEAGESCLDDTVARFLPDYVGTDKADITLFDLMTHTSGIPGQQPLYKQITTREDMLVAIRNLPLRFARGTDVEYTSQGYVVLGTVLEKIYGRGLDALLLDEVLRPLAMNATLYNPGPELHSRIAATEDCHWRGRIVKGQVHDENAVVLGGVCGHAGLFCNVHDLTQVCKAMLSEGCVDNTKFLSPSTVALMSRNHTPHLRLARGLGWQSKDLHNSPAGDLFSRNAFGHTGFTGTSMWIDPDRRLYAVLLTNRVHPSRQSEEIRRVRSIFHNLAVMRAEELN